MPNNSKKAELNWSRLITKNDHHLEQQLTTNLYAHDSRDKTLWQCIATHKKFNPNFDNKILNVIDEKDRPQHHFEINQQHDGISALGIAIQEKNADAVLKLIQFGCSISCAFNAKAGLPEIINQFKDHAYLRLILYQIKESFSDPQQLFDSNNHHILRIVLTEKHDPKTAHMLINTNLDPNLAIDDDYHVLESLFDDPYRYLFPLICSKLNPENIHYASDTRPTPLMIACKQADLGVVEMLLDKCAYAATSHHGKNALHFLAMADTSNENTIVIDRIASLLLQTGAELNQVDLDGNTPLTLSLRHHHVALAMKYLKDPTINIHARNLQYENAMSIAIIGGLVNCCDALINHNQQQSLTEPPYCISTTPSRLPRNFIDKIVPVIAKKTNQSITIEGPLCPVSIAVLLRPIRPEMERLIPRLVNAYVPGQQSMDNPYHIAVTLNDYQTIGLLLQHGIPVKQSTLQPVLEQDNAHSKIIKTYIKTICTTEELLLSGKGAEAEQRAQALNAATIPKHWPLQYWREFGNAYIVACLETASPQDGAQRLHRVFYEANICPLIIKYQAYQNDYDTLVVKILQNIISELQELKKRNCLSNNQSSADDKSRNDPISDKINPSMSDYDVKQRSIDQQEKTQEHEKTKSSSQIDQTVCHHTNDNTTAHQNTLINECHHTDNTDSQSILNVLEQQQLKHTTETKKEVPFTEKCSQWQLLINQIFLKSDSNPTTTTTSSDLKSMFIVLLREEVLKAIFNKNALPECSLEVLRLLNQSPCGITRKLIANQIQIALIEHTVAQQNDSEDVPSPEQNQSIATAQYMLNSHYQLFYQIEQHPLNIEQTYQLAYVLFMLKLPTKETTSESLAHARAFYSAICYQIMTNNSFPKACCSLINWLRKYDVRIKLLKEVSFQKDLLHVSQIKSTKDNEAERDEARDIFLVVAPYLSESIMAAIIHKPRIIHYLHAYPRLTVIQSVSTVLAQLLDSYTSVRLIENSNQNTDRGLPKRVQAIAKEETSGLEELLASRITELENKVDHATKALKSADCESKSREIRIEEVEKELKEKDDTIQRLIRENTQYKAQITGQKESNKTIKTLKKDNQALSHELENLKQALSKQSITIHENKATYDAEILEYNGKIDIYRHQIAGLLSEHSKLKDYANLLHRKIQVTGTQENQQVQELKASIRTARSKHNDLEQQLHQQASAYQAEIHELKQEKKETLETLSRLEQSNRSLQKVNSGLQTQVSTMQQSHLSANSMFLISSYDHLILNSSRDETIICLTQCITELCQSIMAIDAHAQIQWGGSTAIMLARKELELLLPKQFEHLCHLIKSKQEDIDITVITTQTIPIDTMISNRKDSKKHDTQRPRFQITPQNKQCQIDLQLRQRHSVSTNPDAIVWVWSPGDQNWYLTPRCYQAHQQAFLWDNYQILPETYPSYSLYRGLHQWIKQKIFEQDGALSVPRYLLQRKLTSSTRSEVSKEIIEILKKMHATNYWNSALSRLCEIIHVNGKSTSVLNYLLPERATIPSMDCIKSAIQSATSVSDVLCIIKQHWEATETNTKLLNSKIPIDWSTICNKHVTTIETYAPQNNETTINGTMKFSKYGHSIE